MIRSLLLSTSLLITLCSLQAQDTTAFRNTIQAFSESFSQKDFAKVEPYLAPKFHMGQYPVEVAGQIFPQIYAQYPQVQKIQYLGWIQKDEQYKLDILYFLEGDQQDSSSVTVQGDGKLLSIELFEEMMEQSTSQEQSGEPQYIGEEPFLSKKQRKQFYNDLIDQINELDAEGIVVRNSTRKLQWNGYCKKKKKAFLKAKSWDAFKAAYNSFGGGFVNLHSHFDFNMPSSGERKTSNLKIGFTYPEVSFFDLGTGKTITHINGVDIHSVFETFFEEDCGFNGKHGALSSFTRRLESGGIDAKGKVASELTVKNGEKLTISYSPKERSKDPYERYKAGVKLEYPEEWKLLAKGYKVALLQKGEVALIRIKDFLYFKGNGGGLRCEGEARDSTACADIRILREGLTQIEGQFKHLIFDVQGNGGGNENSSFIAEFAQQEFFDLLVQYRKTKHMEDGQLRNGLFYGSQPARKWYERIRNNGDWDNTQYGEFLPARGDFCKGDPSCKPTAIQPNPSADREVQIYVLTNGNCVSSCDDFTWRMKRFSNAKVIGQPQAADATYARISLVQYLTEDGQLKMKLARQGGRGPEVDGVIIATSTIPYSKTVDEKGNLRQGVPVELDLLVPVTKENFDDVENAVLKACEEYID